MNPIDDFPKIQPFQLETKLNYYLRSKKKQKSSLGSAIIENSETPYICQLGFTIENNLFSTAQTKKTKGLPSLTESTILQQKFSRSKNRHETLEDELEEKNQNNSRVLISQEKNDQLNYDYTPIVKRSFVITDVQSKLLSPTFQSKQRRQDSHQKSKGSETQQIQVSRQNFISGTQGIVQDQGKVTSHQDNEIFPSRSETVQSNAAVGSLEKIKRKIKAVQIMNRFKLSPQKSKGMKQNCIDLYQEFKEFLFTGIFQKDNEQILKLCFNIMERCMQNNLFRFFIQISNFLGQFTLYFILVICSQFFLDIHEFDKASFFQSQYKLMAEMAFFFKEKAEALFHLAKIAQLIQKHDQALIILKKSLEFAWFSDDLNLELQIYEQLGINYFYLGLTQEANFYHHKFVSGDNELPSSPIRQISSSIIRKYLIHIQMIPVKEFNQHFLTQISIPVENKFKCESNNSSYKRTRIELCSDTKIITYRNAQVEQIFEKLLKEKDFENYQLDRPVNGRLKSTHERQIKLGILNCNEDQNYLQYDKLNSTVQQLDFSFAEKGKPEHTKRSSYHRSPFIKSRFQAENKLDHSSIIDSEPHKFNIPLKRLLETRQKQSNQLEKKLQIIKDQIQHNVGRGQIQVRDKIFLSHSKVQKQFRAQKQQNDPAYLISKYDTFFQNFLSTLPEEFN